MLEYTRENVAWILQQFINDYKKKGKNKGEAITYLSKASGVSERQIRAISKGDANFTIDTINALAPLIGWKFCMYMEIKKNIFWH